MIVVNNIKKHGIDNIQYFGEVGNSLVRVVFEDGALPIEGDIKVLSGKLITKNGQNYYYIKKYRR